MMLYMLEDKYNQLILIILNNDTAIYEISQKNQMVSTCILLYYVY